MILPLGDLEWVRPKAWKMDWELRRGAEVVARMYSPSFFGTTVRASLGDENYVNRKGGLRRPGAVISRVGAPGDLGQLEFDALDHGTVVLADGKAYRWEKRDPPGTWAMTSGEGKLLFTIYRDARSKYPSGKVKILTEDKNSGILLILTWFMVSTSEF